MKRLLMTLFIGLALVACSNPNANTNNTDQNNGTKNEAGMNNNKNETANNNNNNGTTNNASNTNQTSYLEGFGFSNIKNVNEKENYKTYTLNETTAINEDVYGQWMYTWVEPSEYVEQDINVYQYTATKDNKNYDVFVMTDTKNNVIGGYYYEQGKSMKDAKILDEKHQPRIVEEFRATWDKLFNINQSNGTNSSNTTDTQGQNR